MEKKNSVFTGCCCACFLFITLTQAAQCDTIPIVIIQHDERTYMLRDTLRVFGGFDMKLDTCSEIRHVFDTTYIIHGRPGDCHRLPARTYPRKYFTIFRRNN